MPTATFYKLPEAKRDKLKAAIKRELARVPFDEVSINKIVRDAKIARGSFYQYFSGKDDMLEYILLESRKKMFGYLQNVLKSNGGDIFDMFYKILEFNIDLAQDEELSFQKNLLSDIKVNTEFYLKFPKDERKSETVKLLLPYINTNALNISCENGFFDLLTILMAVCRVSIADAFMNVENCEQIKNRYKRQLNMLKNAFERKKGTGNA